MTTESHSVKCLRACVRACMRVCVEGWDGALGGGGVVARARSLKPGRTCLCKVPVTSLHCKFYFQMMHQHHQPLAVGGL